MAKKISSNRTTDGVMIFSNSFVAPELAFNTNGNYSSTNANTILSKLRVSEDSHLNLSTIKTKFFKENTQIKNSFANINTPASKNIEYYKHEKINSGMYGGFNVPNNRENIFAPSPDILFGMNNYRFQFSNQLTHILSLIKGDDPNSEVKAITSKADVVPALFNPIYMVSVKGLSNNVPLLNSPGKLPGADNLTDCSIKELVSLSQDSNSILGVAKYRYVDFMYCKDLGKVSNNHLITLRVFPFPVGDHIQEGTGGAYNDPEKFFTFSSTGDVGRLVTWFGTDDNKLEDILKFEYHATWKELKAEIEEISSQENDQSRGPLGMLINTFSPQYNNGVEKGYSSNQSLWGKIIGGSAPGEESNKIYTNYDKNKVYEPKDTIQDTYTYEGKLEFTSEFTLNFSYKLRAYDNINPKSAFLDLLGNILAVTYRRGHFWGGDRKFLGPPQNTTAWNKANKIIDQKFDQIGGVFKGLLNNGINFQSLLGHMSGLINGAEQLLQSLKNNVKDAGGIPQYVNKVMTEMNDKFNFSDALKGNLKNVIGRPALYAMNSLLTGDDVGLWHVTIGNPKNPIASMGNLIITNASITHSGPLGIDDFPTEIKVSVTLKHGRGRDAVEISKMYANGLRSLYAIPKTEDITQYYGHTNGVSKVTFDKDGNATSVEYTSKNGEVQKNKKTPQQLYETSGQKIKETQVSFAPEASLSNKEIKNPLENSSNLPQNQNKVDTAIKTLSEGENYGQISDVMIHRVLNEIR